MSQWKITKEINKEYKNKGINKFRYQIQNINTKEHKSFYGISKCGPEDIYIIYFGGMLAELRALDKLYKYLWEIDGQLLKKENGKNIILKKEDFFIKRKIITKNIISLIDSIYYNNKIKARVEDEVRRKKNNMPSRQEEFRNKLNELLRKNNK